MTSSIRTNAMAMSASRRSAAAGIVGAALALALAGCSLTGGGSSGSGGGGGAGTSTSPGAATGTDGTGGTSGTDAGTHASSDPSAAGSGGAGAASGAITLVTHDSFNITPELLEDFTASTGIEVTQIAPGDGGALVNQLVLTKQSPLGDVVFGVDNTYATRALDEGVFAPYTSPALPAAAEPYLLGDELTPIDFSDVCLNADLAWYEENGQTPPASFEDLLLPEYAGHVVVTNPATSSPGLAFLAATVGAFGPSAPDGSDGWAQYWKSLRDNDLLVVDGWSDAYYVDFSGGGGDGSRPVVLSYASSPPATLGEDGQPTTAALLDTCFRQVEYAGVLTGAANPEGAQAFIDFLLSEPVQADVPGQMYVYPIDPDVALPADWAEFAPLSPKPWEVPAADLSEHRSDWIELWTNTVLR